ncbi:metal-sulfur cluster assembly factor [Candidatus Woesearchaeota archaeon]|nr:metal-sulfur cluster assembly factor [Candidatus Woesearchaeota archaeon]
MATKEEVIEALKKVNDPEIGIDVYTLELIYDVKVEDGRVEILMTLTTPMCPYGPMLIEEIRARVRELKGVKEVDVEVTFDPPWQPSEQLRATLGV